MFGNKDGDWIPSEYQYVSPITKKAPKFIGRRPVGQCNLQYSDKESCQLDPRCTWIENVLGEEYCRSAPGMVSRPFPSQVRYQSDFSRITGGSKCAYKNQNSCTSDPDCRWIETVTGARYCRGMPGQTRSFSQHLAKEKELQLGRQSRSSRQSRQSRQSLSGEQSRQSRKDQHRVGEDQLGRREREHTHRQLLSLRAMDAEFFTLGSNRFNLYRWRKLPDAVKNQVFSQEGMEEFRNWAQQECQHIRDSTRRKQCEDIFIQLFAKYCRCLLEVPAANAFRQGGRTQNAYAICNASISRSSLARDLERISQRQISAKQIRSALSRLARAQQCSQTLDIDNIPTSFLYGYVVNHLSTSKGRQVFQEVPEVAEFLQDRESYRPLLVKYIKKYIAEGHRR